MHGHPGDELSMTLAVGDTLRGIVLIVRALANAESAATESGQQLSAGDRLAMMHSGRPWSFWASLFETYAVANKVGGAGFLTRGTTLAGAQMEDSFRKELRRARLR